jgi:hypothetical protein
MYLVCQLAAILEMHLAGLSAALPRRLPVTMWLARFWVAANYKLSGLQATIRACFVLGASNAFKIFCVLSNRKVRALDICSAKLARSAAVS